jgi:anaerobic magnesium-protoporphyrin IX monomethyl ester cyclase
MEFPVFVAYVASVLREVGHNVAVTDAMVEGLSLASLKERMLDFGPDAVIVETVPHTFEGDIRIADIVKEIDHGIYTIFYGWQATARPRDVLSNPNVDFVIRGEPEHTSMELISTLERERDVSDIKGLSYIENNVIRNNPKRPFIEPLDQLPFPARDLFPMEKYRAVPFEKITTVVASRGCPFHCIYCPASLMDGHKFRKRDPERVVDEIEHVVSTFKTKTFFFYADTFTLWNNKNIVQFCQELLQRKLDIRWLINSRVDTLPPENILKHMAKSGCFLIQFGVESGSPKMVRAMNKAINAKNYVNVIKTAIQRTKKVGIFTNARMIIGFQGEDEETIIESVNCIKESAPDFPVTFGIVRPDPGTSLGGIAEDKGLVPPDGEGWRWSELKKSPLALSAVLNNCSPYEIRKLQKMANDSFNYSLIDKLKLGVKFSRRKDFDILLSLIKFLIKTRNIPSF